MNTIHNNREKHEVSVLTRQSPSELNCRRSTCLFFEGKQKDFIQIFFRYNLGAVTIVAHMVFIPLHRGAHVRGMWLTQTRFLNSALLKVKYHIQISSSVQFKRPIGRTTCRSNPPSLLPNPATPMWLLPVQSVLTLSLYGNNCMDRNTLGYTSFL